MSLLSRFRNQWRRRALDHEFDDELQFHLDARAEANVRGGMSRADAEAEAKRHLGSTLRAREGMREARALSWLESVARDMAQGARMFRGQPGLASLAVFTLSLGVGANAAIFSLLDALLFRPLPFADADRLVAIVDGLRSGGDRPMDPTIPELLDVKAWSRNLEAVSFSDRRDFQLGGGSEPLRVLGGRAEPSLFDLLGVRAAHGRLLREEDGRAGNGRVVILTDGLWRRNFGADQTVVGRQVIVNGLPHSVIGVLPADFAYDSNAAEPVEMYLPYPMVPLYTSRDGEFANIRRVLAIAKLAPDRSLANTAAEVRAIAGVLVQQYPQLYRRGSDGRDVGFFMNVVPLREHLTGAARPILSLLLGAVGLVLFIACVNTAQFLLARAIERGPEVGIRSALGARRGRLIRQFLAEALVLAGAAGVLGLVQAAWLIDVLKAMLPDGAPAIGAVQLDRTVIVFAGGVALATTLLCGLLPAIHFSRGDGHARLDTRGATRSRTRLRQVLIALEAAVSVMLLVSAGLLIRSIRDLQAAPHGYEADDVTVMQMRGMGGGPGAAEPIGAVYQRYLDRIAAVPDVQAAAVASTPIASGAGVEFSIESRGSDAATLSRQQASYQIVSLDYFSVLGIPLRQGRTFGRDDATGRPPVAMVNEEMARRFWPGASPIGREIRAGQGPRAATMTIVGVVGNVRPMFQRGDVPQIYVPSLQQSEPSIFLLVRHGPRPASIEAVKQAIWSVQPQQAVFSIRPLTEIASAPIQDQRVVATLLGSFAALALIMSCAGIYGVVSYLTSRRVKEMAIRQAMGATKRDVVGLLAGQTFGWTIAGLLAGVGGAVAASGALRAAVGNVGQLTATTVIGVAAVYLVVAALAMSVPAIRALRLHPSSALRAE